ncbi:MAG: BatA domain-containing protein [Candidatus Brocadiia bacterium]
MPTFVNPWALSGLLLASAPVIIHLLNRRRFKVVEWAAMEYLLASNRRNFRRIRLEQLILLALRVLLVALLILLVSRPRVARQAIAGLAERDRFVLLVFDNSMSMGYRDGSTSSYDRALSFAEQLMASLRDGDRWALVTTEEGGRAVVREPSFELDAARAAVTSDRLPLCDDEGSIPGALEAAEQMLDDVAGPARELYIVTDMQRGAWGRGSGAVAAQEVGLLRRISEGAATTVVDVGPESPANLAVTSLHADSRLAVTEKTLLVYARVSNFGLETATDVSVKFLVDDFQQPAGAAKDIAPGGWEQWEFRHQFRTPGAHVVAAELEADALPRDNRRYLAVQARQGVPVLCVDGEPGGGWLAGEVDFLREALQPEAPGEGQRLGLYEPEVVTVAGLAAADLARYDLVVLANVASLEGAQVESLERYVADGGALLVFLGDQVDREFYNEVLFADGESLLPCPLGPVLGSLEEPGQATHISDELPGHPFLELVRKWKSVQLSRPFFYRYIRLEESRARDGARVVCRFQGGEPALVEAEHGKGRVVLFASTADDEWNDMHKWPAYLALLHEVGERVARDPSRSRNVEVGEPLVRYLPARFAGRSLSLLRPQEDQPVPVRATTSRNLVAAIYEATDRAGIYELSIEGGDQPGPGQDTATVQDYFAVNVPAGESDLRRVSEEELERLFPGARLAYQRGPARRSPVSVAGERGELWRSLAYALLALLFVESVLAQRFGR